MAEILLVGAFAFALYARALDLREGGDSIMEATGMAITAPISMPIYFYRRIKGIDRRSMEKMKKENPNEYRRYRALRKEKESEMRKLRELKQEPKRKKRETKMIELIKKEKSELEEIRYKKSKEEEMKHKIQSDHYE